MYLQHLQALCSKLSGKEAFFIYNPFNVFYLAGMKSSNAYLIVDADGGHYFTDFRYYLAATKQLSHLQVHDLEDLSYTQFLSEKEYDKVLFEPDLPWFLFKKIDEKTTNLLPDERILPSLRMKKSSEEIRRIEKVQALTTQAFDRIIDYVKKNHCHGISEWDIVCYIRSLMDEFGFQSLSFDPIVAFDANSAIPHYSPSKTQVMTDETYQMLIDFGYCQQHYCSDFTRMIFFDNAPEETVACYDLLVDLFADFEQNFQHFEHVGEIDGFFRMNIEEAGFGEYFRHSTGHSLGLECHEAPPISIRSAEPLHEGLVFTIEPGIYLPGIGGARLEDLFCVQKGQLKNLTNYNRDAIIIERN